MCGLKNSKEGRGAHLELLSVSRAILLRQFARVDGEAKLVARRSQGLLPYEIYPVDIE